ncbi:MAG: LamG domain-containing protein [Candidatus Pacearchaeota archaeon]|nr:LamG domain-containing protein [Candidatus Pacearchaeota archaeon]
MKKSVIIAIAVGVIILIAGAIFLLRSPTQPETFPEDNGSSQEIPSGGNSGQVEGNLVLSYPDEKSFNGVDDFVDLSSSVSEVKPITEGTIALSFKFDSLLDTQSIMPVLYFGMDNENDPDNMFVIEMGHSGGSFGEGSSSQPDPSNKKLYVTWMKDNQQPFLCFDSNENLEENVWYHLTVVVDETGNRGYLNGAEMTNRDYNFGSSSDVKFFNSIPNPEKLWIGKGRSSYMISPNFVYFKGSVKDLRIYDKALTESEITELV